MCHGVCASDVTGLACGASDVTGLACVMASVRQMSCHVMLKLLLLFSLVAAFLQQTEAPREFSAP